jgi:hypothetical protein
VNFTVFSKLFPQKIPNFHDIFRGKISEEFSLKFSPEKVYDKSALDIVHSFMYLTASFHEPKKYFGRSILLLTSILITTREHEEKTGP